MTKELEVAIKAAKEAGKILKENFYKINPITFKGDGGSLTKIDKLSENKIVSTIKENFPDHSINAEESGLSKKDSEYLWLVDPIDGTSNFAAQIPFFAVSVALAKDKKMQLGVVYEPIQENLYIAEKNKVASLNNNKVSVSVIDSLKRSITSSGRAPLAKEEFIRAFTKLEKSARTQRVLGSMTLELCYVAVGKMEAALLFQPNPWDLAAGALLVEEAKGAVTDFEGNPWSLESKNIIASNGRIHRELLDILNLG